MDGKMDSKMDGKRSVSKKEEVADDRLIEKWMIGWLDVWSDGLTIHSSEKHTLCDVTVGPNLDGYKVDRCKDRGKNGWKTSSSEKFILDDVTGHL